MPKVFWNKVFLKNSHLCSTRLQNRNLYWIFLDEVGSDQSGGILSPFMGTTCLIFNHFPVPVHNWIKQQICISSERFNFSIGIKWDECLLIIGTNTVECNNLSMPWIPASGTTSLIHTHTHVYIYIYIFCYNHPCYNETAHSRTIISNDTNSARSRVTSQYKDAILPISGSP